MPVAWAVVEAGGDEESAWPSSRTVSSFDRQRKPASIRCQKAPDGQSLHATRLSINTTHCHGSSFSSMEVKKSAAPTSHGTFKKGVTPMAPSSHVQHGPGFHLSREADGIIIAKVFAQEPSSTNRAKPNLLPAFTVTAAVLPPYGSPFRRASTLRLHATAA